MELQNLTFKGIIHFEMDFYGRGLNNKHLVVGRSLNNLMLKKKTYSDPTDMQIKSTIVLKQPQSISTLQQARLLITSTPQSILHYTVIYIKFCG